MRGIGWELITGVFVIAVVYMLVRPQSPAATAINSLTAMSIGMVQYATGDHSSF